MTKVQIDIWRGHLVDVLFDEIQIFTGQGCRGFEQRHDYMERMIREGRITNEEFLGIQEEVLS